MTTTHSSADPMHSQATPDGASSVVFLLRLEGLAAAALSAGFYARTGRSWWLFGGLWVDASRQVGKAAEGSYSGEAESVLRLGMRARTTSETPKLMSIPRMISRLS